MTVDIQKVRIEGRAAEAGLDCTAAGKAAENKTRRVNPRAMLSLRHSRLTGCVLSNIAWGHRYRPPRVAG